jgi:hypothetical protein
MKNFVLAMFAVVLMCSVSFGQDCSSGTCARPVASVVHKAASVAVAPVRYVAKNKPVRGFLRRLCCR